MATYSAFADVAAPTNPNSETIGVSLATEFVCQPGWLLGYRYVRPSVAMVGPLTAAFYVVASGTADPATLVSSIAPGPPGWNDVLLPAPVHFASEVRARPTVHHSNGRYAFLNNAFASNGTWPAGKTNGPLHAPQSSATANGNGLFLAGASIAMPTNMFDETFYFIDLLWSDTNPNTRTGTGHIGVRTALATAGRKRGTGTGTTGVDTALSSTGRSRRRGTGSIGVTTNATTAGRKEARGTGGIAVATSMRGIGRNPDDVVVPARVTVGPPGDRWYVGPPT